MFFSSILLPDNSLSGYSKKRASSSAGSMLVTPVVLTLRGWVDESLRHESTAGWQPEPQFGGCQEDTKSPSPAARELAEGRRSGPNKSDLRVFLVIAGGHSS